MPTILTLLFFWLEESSDIHTHSFFTVSFGRCVHMGRFSNSLGTALLMSVASSLLIMIPVDKKTCGLRFYYTTDSICMRVHSRILQYKVTSIESSSM